MKKAMKALTPLSLFVRFLAVGALGLLVLSRPDFVQRFLVLLCICALLANGLPAIAVSIFGRKEPHPHAFLTGLVSVGLALLLVVFPSVLRGSIAFAVGLWSLLTAVVQLSYVVQLFATHEKGKIKFLLLGVLSLLAAIFMLTNLLNGGMLSLVAGGYLLLYALWQLMDMAGVLINRNVESSRFLTRFRVHPPVLLTAMLPSILLRRLSAKYEYLTKNIVIECPAPPSKPCEETIDVIFHLGADVAMGFGHVDVSLRGKTYSYGCYDASSNRLFGLVSDGIFLTCDTEPYLRYCRQQEKKLLIGFTLGLSSAHAHQTETGMQRIFESICEPWTPEGRPEYSIGAKFIRIKRGKFAVYNVFKTNCAAIAEIIAAQSGLNLLPPNGFVTPGAYYDYLQAELRDPTSSVLRETIYAHLT